MLISISLHYPSLKVNLTFNFKLINFKKVYKIKNNVIDR